jgi:mannose/fructose/N-acetylgalactosamine-specific phosphotransferase system component IID
MKTTTRRIVIYAKDIETITGRRLRTCYAILSRIRKFHNKKKQDFVTVREFCSFLNMDEQLVKEVLGL